MPGGGAGRRDEGRADMSTDSDACECGCADVGVRVMTGRGGLASRVGSGFVLPMISSPSGRLRTTRDRTHHEVSTPWLHRSGSYVRITRCWAGPHPH